jgi:hypothetical protein
MKHDDALTPPIAPRLWLMVCFAALAVAFTVSRPHRIYAHDNMEPPAVPDNLRVPPGHKVFLKGHAIGTQNYMCLPDRDGNIIWMLIGPQATLFDDEKKQIITHFLSRNPDEDGVARATWQHSRDTSTVWARPIESADVVGAIPWLLLKVVGVEPGPTGGQRLTRTKFIQRLNTVGGIAPSTSCPAIGQRAFVRYEADYVFYRATEHE